MDAQKLGLFISKVRKENNMTQQELADKLSVSNKTISKWETGKGVPSIDILEPLSESLNISIMELLRQERLEKEEYTNDDINEVLKESVHYPKRKKGSFVDWLFASFVVFLYCIIFFVLSAFQSNIFSIFLMILTVISALVSVWRIYNHEDYVRSLTIFILLFFTFFLMALLS